MKRAILFTLLLLCSILNSVAQIGKVGINTNIPLAMLHVSDSSVLFTGPVVLPVSPGLPPVNGAGTRLMWYVDKAALRAGKVDGLQWSRDSIGQYSMGLGLNSVAIGSSSVAMGNNCRASGLYAFAMGGSNKATGTHSVALGASTKATGSFSTTLGVGTQASGSHTLAIGFASKASGNYSFAAGYGTEASGWHSASFGYLTKSNTNNSFSTGLLTLANGYAATSIGMYNDSIVAPQNAPTSATPLFIIGNGDSDVLRSNAMVVRKDGWIGLGINSPSARLHLLEATGGGLYHSQSDVIIEDDGSAFIQFSSPNAGEAGLLSGNTTTSIRSALIFRADNGIDLRSGGNTTRMQIESDGDIHMMSGEVHRTSTGTANLVPICYGSVNSAGSINSGTNNFTVINPSTGRYDITITGENYTGSGYTTSVSPISSSARIVSCSSSGGDLIVYIFDAAGTLVDNGFQFLVFQQ